MSRSKRRPKPKKPGDGCFFCDPVAQEEARRKAKEKQNMKDVASDVQSEGQKP